MTDLSKVKYEDGKYTFEVGMDNKNIAVKEQEIEKAIKRAISYMITKVVNDNSTNYSELLTTSLDTFTPIENIYHNMGENLSSENLISEKKLYFKGRIKIQLQKNESGDESRLYFLLKDLL